MTVTIHLLWSILRQFYLALQFLYHEMTSYCFWQDRIKIKNKSHTEYSYIIINGFIIHLCNVCNKLSCY